MPVIFVLICALIFATIGFLCGISSERMSWLGTRGPNKQDPVINYSRKYIDGVMYVVLTESEYINLKDEQKRTDTSSSD